MLSGAALIGCGAPACPAVQLPRSHVPKLVDQYSAERRAVVDAHPGLVVTPDNEPRLVVGQRVNVPGEAQPVIFPVGAQLGTTRRHGDRLLLERQPVQLDQVEEAALVFGTESTDSSLAPWTEHDLGCTTEQLPTAAERFAEVRQSKARAREGFERRHYLGLQLGGTGVFQVAYRVRAIERLHVDMGLFGSNGAFNTSLGLLNDAWLGKRTAAYLGAGGGVLATVGESSCGGESEPDDCFDSGAWLFGYLRAGLALRLGARHRDVLGFDIGLWHGRHNESGPNVSRSERFTWPMAGFSYHRAL